jgi:tRNA threonylcarbamoyladenosine biosynthesis protein TsaE
MQVHKTVERQLNTLEDTRMLSEEIANEFKGGDVLLLFGDLGAGKTTTAKMILQTLGVVADITSPTFTLMNVYELPKAKNGITTAIHIDAYRIEAEHELTDIGLQDYLGQPGTVCLIEWPEKIPTLLQNKKTVSLYLEHATEGRMATLTL